MEDTRTTRRTVDWGAVRTFRSCSRSGCPRAAVATLTYDHAASTAVLGPLVANCDPHAYDLCEEHAQSLTVPRGWQAVRLINQFPPRPIGSEDPTALSLALQDRDAAAASRLRPEGNPEPGTPYLRVVPDLT